MGSLHSVTLNAQKCVGCTDCIKRCPTEAIRVRDSKAHILDNRCIDCGECIKVCKNGAKMALTDSLDEILEYKYKVAIPAPTLYAQFKGIRNPNIILTALLELGFDEVFEVAKAAEKISDYTKEIIKDMKKPVISSACPAVVRLIEMRFPSLMEYVLPIISPMEAVARYAVDYLTKKGIKREDIGIFFISPCAAKVTTSKNPENFDKSEVDGVIGIKDIYKRLYHIIKKLQANPKDIKVLATAKSQGVGWALSGGESIATDVYDCVSVHGIENIINILELLENKEFSVDFAELLACTNGCLGGPLTVENPFVASNRMQRVKKYIDTKGKFRELDYTSGDIKLEWDYGLKNRKSLQLDKDMNIAMAKLERLEEIYKTLPKIDCGSCGAPTCRALAEDIVQGRANIEDCIFMLRDKVRDVAAEMVELAEKLPPSIR